MLTNHFWVLTHQLTITGVVSQCDGTELNTLPQAQMKKRAEGREETEDDKESPKDEVVPPPSPMPRLPRTAAQLAGAARVLPPIGATDRG